MSLFDYLGGLGGAGSGLVPPQYLEKQSASSMAYMPNLKQRLELAVQQAEERLQAIREAKEIFDRNPDIEKLLNIMQSGHF